MHESVISVGRGAPGAMLALTVVLAASILTTCPQVEARFQVLNPDDFETYLGSDLEWAEDNIPFFEVPDEDITAAYYFRWQVYRKHIRFHPEVGHVVTEYLPDVPWAGEFNTIVGIAGHHIYEGRWLRNSTFMDDYSRFWVSPYALPLEYTEWLADAVFARFQVDPRLDLLAELLPGLADIYRAWQNSTWVEEAGCFYSGDTEDAQQNSISGNGCRVLRNSIMYGELVALANMQQALGDEAESAATAAEAEVLRGSLLQRLWHPEVAFLGTYKTEPPPAWSAPYSAEGIIIETRCDGAPEWPQGQVVPVRELSALTTPFTSRLVPKANASDLLSMWDQAIDPEGFAAEWGPRTAERRSPYYNFTCDSPSTWNAPSWPFETCKLLAGLANLLNDYPPQANITGQDWFDLLAQFARAHTRSVAVMPTDEYGAPAPPHPWIDEDLHPDLGYWYIRDYLYRQGAVNVSAGEFWWRGYQHLHSTFCDLVITGLVGLRPDANDRLILNPLVPQDIEWFAVDNLLYHGIELSIAWDESGERYGHGPGLTVWADGQLLANSTSLQPLQVDLPAVNASDS